jgi:hypothetical protein
MGMGPRQRDGMSDITIGTSEPAFSRWNLTTRDPCGTHGNRNRKAPLVSLHQSRTARCVAYDNMTCEDQPADLTPSYTLSRYQRNS